MSLVDRHRISRRFYLKYHLYRNSFPVLALSNYLKTRGVQ